MEAEFLCCPVCYEQFNQFTRIPKILTFCGHTICSDCLKNIFYHYSNPKCPLDNKVFGMQQRRFQDFPTNIVVNHLLETRFQKCLIHKEKFTFLCLNDGNKICGDCAWIGNHKGHKIRPIKMFKQEVHQKKKQVQDLLDDLDGKRKDITKVFEEKRALLIRTVKNKFKKMRSLLSMKKVELISEIDSLFDMEIEWVENIIGSSSILRDNMLKNGLDLASIFENKEFIKDDSLMARIQKDILEFKSKTRENFFQSDIERMSKECEQMIKSFDCFSRAPIEYLSNLKFSFTDSLGLEEKNSSAFDDDCKLQKENQINTAFKVQSSFSFEYSDNCLKISNKKSNAKTTLVDIKEWGKAEEVKLKLDQEKFQGRDLATLSYVWRRLKLATSLILKLNLQSYSNDIYRVLLQGARNFSSIHIEMKDSKENIGQKEAVFIGKLLARMKNLKELSIMMDETKLSPKDMEAIFKSQDVVFRKLEKLKLSFNESSITDKAMKHILVAIPHLRKFSLSIDENNITDHSLMLLSKNTLSSTRYLKNLKLCLGDTKVTDIGMYHLFAGFKNLKKLKLDMNNTRITDKSISLLTLGMAGSWETLKKFFVSFKNTKISDDGLCQIFHKMPNVESLSLSLSKTKITDKWVEVFVEKTLCSIKALKNLKMSLAQTEVSDTGIEILINGIKDLRTLELCLESTDVSDRSIEVFINEKLPTIGGLKKLKINLFDTLVSYEVRSQINELTRLSKTD